MGCSALALLVHLPLRTRSEGNMREPWQLVAKRKHEHRAMAKALVAAALRHRDLKPANILPVRVTLTRVGPRVLDDDNLAGSCKFLRDGVADALGVDDGDRARVRWRYRQQKGTRKLHEVKVMIETRRIGR